MKWYLNTALKNIVKLVFLLLFSSSVLAKDIDWPNPTVSEATKIQLIARMQVINGLPIRSFDVSFDDSLKEVIDLYKKQWRRPANKDIDPYIIRQAGPWLIISRFEQGFMHAVQLVEKDEKTIGFYSISNLEYLEKHGAVKSGEGFPTPNGSKVVSDILAYDIGLNSRTLILFNKKNLHSNVNFYRRHYQNKGWVLLSNPGDPKGRKDVLNFGRGDESLAMTFSRSPDRKSTEIVAVLSKRLPE
ncbi:hypothetical protein [Motilimonas cestriensis]|uniref:hypothetical protein n=1 Tax=Motilimonas cestriensis TaxID=2742685 RepID=UPI003DA6C952